MSCPQNEGNEAFKAAKYPESVQLYTQGLDIDPDNHILYSNRSAAYLKINERGKVSKSTADPIGRHILLGIYSDTLNLCTLLRVHGYNL